MALDELVSVANAMVAPRKGILAADESTGTIKKRLDSIDVESTEDSRRAYRELLFRTEDIGDFVSGVILFDETIRQKAADGTPFVDVLNDAGVIPGIKVDAGAKPLAGAPGEKVTEGLDGLRERLAEYYEIGARFAKWRAVIDIGAGMPSAYAIDTNTHALARYAALCQEASIVPIVEPEVIMDGDHTAERCQEVTEATLMALYKALFEQRVVLEGTILKPNMIVSGTDCPTQAGIDEVAERTIACFQHTVPSAVPGICFLSGGQSEEEATAHLNAMNAKGPLPWELSFSYGRALQASALQAWGGRPENVPQAQAAFKHRAHMNSLARSGSYEPSAEQRAA
ncbi:MAG: class I fructose-bisphosphate aldolase [Alphaproteobacteria bacterium]